MNSRKIMSLVLAGVVLAVSTVSIAARPGRGRPMNGKPGPGIERMIDHIPDLSSEQEQQIYAIIDPVRSEMRSARKEQKELRQEIRELEKKGAAEATVNAKIDELAQKQATIMKKNATLRRQVFEMLTTEQKEALAEKRSTRKRKGGKQ